MKKQKKKQSDIERLNDDIYIDIIKELLDEQQLAIRNFLIDYQQSTIKKLKEINNEKTK